jgi:hypothetical protein
MAMTFRKRKFLHILKYYPAILMGETVENHENHGVGIAGIPEDILT